MSTRVIGDFALGLEIRHVTSETSGNFTCTGHLTTIAFIKIPYYQEMFIKTFVNASRYNMTKTIYSFGLL